MNILSGMPHKRRRRTKQEMEILKSAILDIVGKHEELTVRHLFYLMVAAGTIEKTEAEYNNVVIRLALEPRRDGLIPFGKIVDGTRLYRIPRSYGSIKEALEETAGVYRRDYWRNADQLVEVWCEKEAISGFLHDVTAPLGVPLMVTRGFSSESVVQSVAEEAMNDGRPLTILFVSDLDPSGALIPDNVLERIRYYAPEADISLERIAVTRDQVRQFNLPTRPTKRDGNRHAKNFDGESVEVDAMPPAELKRILRTAIESRMDARELKVLKQAEASERATLYSWAGAA